MLLKFEVKNFKGFKDWFLLDFSNTSEFKFNPECIKISVVNKAMIYGANGSGKSNLGFAIFDIISHLTNKDYGRSIDQNFLNANTDNDLAEFKLFFKFGKDIVEYQYGKQSKTALVYEYLKVNDELFISLDRRKSSSAVVKLEGAESLNTEIGDSKISIINYVKNNTILSDTPVNSAFSKFIDFVDGMLFFRSLSDNYYLGIEQDPSSIAEDIIQHDNILDFQTFLNDAGIECILTVMERNGEPSLAFSFDDKPVYFFDVASTGTCSLALFYFWYQRLKEDSKVSMVFVDEFDAFYHHDLSKLIVSRLKEIDAQVVLTTHNTSLMTNDLLRPDCYFLMNKEEINPLSQCTEKELRNAHNLEKMYKAGAFNV